MSDPATASDAITMDEATEQALALALRCGLQLWAEPDDAAQEPTLALRFRAPTGGLSPELRQALTLARPAIVQWLGPGRRVVRAADGQAALWMADQLGPESGAYLLTLAWRVERPRHSFRHSGRPLKTESAAPAASAEWLQAALQTLVNRHAALRTRLLAVGDVWCQSIADMVPLSFEHTQADDDDTALLAQAQAAARRPFDEHAHSLFRAHWIEGPTQAAVVLVLHHAIGDAHSVDILARELQALQQGQPLPPVTGRYADFAAQQARNDGRRADPKAPGRGLDPSVWAPLSPPPPGSDAPTTVRVQRTLGAESCQRARQSLARAGITPFQCVITGLAFVLARRLCTATTAADTSSDPVSAPGAPFGEVLLATPVTLRDEATQDTVGYFGQLQALRLQLPKQGSVATAWADAAQQMQDALDPSAPAFNKHSGAGVDLGATLLLTLRTVDVSIDQTVSAGVLALAPQAAKAALALEVAVHPDGWTFSLESDATRVDPALAQEALDALTRWIEHAVDNPAAPAHSLPVVSLAAEQWQAHAAQRASTALLNRGLHEWVLDKALNNPQALAVDFDRLLSYRELLAWADAVATDLRGRGIGAGDRVAVSWPRSAAMVVSWLGILKVGAAYVPLDESYPAARLAFMLSDARVSACLGPLPDSVRQALVAQGAGPVPSLSMPEGWAQGTGPVGIPHSEFSTAEPSGTGDWPACILYTSGSTGRSKGVMVPHRAIVRLVIDSGVPGLGAGANMGQASNASFDAASYEVWGALVHGGTIVGIEPAALLDPAAMKSRLQAKRVDGLLVTTALFNQYTLTDPGLLRSVPGLLIGGEPVSAAMLHRAWQAGVRQAWCVYGPTETGTLASAMPALPIDARATRVPVGGPIGHTGLRVVDALGRLAAPGVPGELWITGAGLAHGYWDRPDQTADRFVPDPWGPPGSRAYRSGDRARLLPGGLIDIVGRLDEQVKIRGFRVEPGEVQALLEATPGVMRAVVQAWRADPTHPWMLRAWIQGQASVADVLADLARRAPPFMIPAQLQAVSHLPITPNGKIDRAALPGWTGPTEPQDSVGTPAASGMPADVPRVEAVDGPTGKLMAAFEQVLKPLSATSIGPDTHFFDAGGHSLTAMGLVHHLRRSLGQSLTLADLYRHPTPRALASWLTQAKIGSASTPDAPSHEESGPATDWPHRTDRSRHRLSPAQERLWLQWRLEPDPASMIIPMAARLIGPCDATRIQAALDRLVLRHSVLRTRFVLEPQGPMALVEERAGVQLERLAVEPSSWPESLDQLLREPMDIEHGPPMRALLWSLGATGDEEHLLILLVHHIVADGWSIQLLMRDLAALMDGREPAPITLDYGDVAQAQAEAAQRTSLASGLQWWCEHLADIEPLDLPRDPGASMDGAPRAALVHAQIDPTHWQALRARGKHRPLLGSLSAALGAVLARWTGQQDIVLGTVLAGREHPQTRELVGPLIETLPLRLDCSGDPSLDMLEDRATQALSMLERHREVPFQRIVAALDQQRHRHGAVFGEDTRPPPRTPVFQALIVIQHFGTATLTRSDITAPQGLRVEPLALLAAAPKYDLTVTVGLNGELAIEYDARCFEPTAMQAVVDALKDTVERVVGSGAARLSALPSPHANHHAPCGIECGPSASRPAGIGSPATASATTGGLRGPEGQWTWDQCDTLIERWSAVLGRHAVGAETIVGLLGGRSAAQWWAVHAVLKAGGAFLPLDPDQPPARLLSMMKRAGCRHLIALDDAAASVVDALAGPIAEPSDDCLHASSVGSAAVSGLVRFTVDGTDLRGLTEPPGRNEAVLEDAPQAVAAHPDQAAYVLFTSGSSGQPKGVVVSRGALNHHMAWMHAEGLLSADDRLLLKTPLGFDASLWEYLLPPMHRATLCVADPLAHRSPTLLLQAIQDHAATAVQLVPSMLTAMMAEPKWPVAARSLRWIACGGEGLPMDIVKRVHQDLSIPVINLYGPTETTIDASWWPLVPLPAPAPAPTAAAAQPIKEAQRDAGSTSGRSVSIAPIGRPLPGLVFRVLDPWGHPVRPGRAGRLYIGGPSLARAYAGRPDLSAERFIPDAWATTPGQRLYDTGDLVQFDQSGLVQWLARADAQIKLRGMRIEPGEIEQVLRAMPGVAEVVVGVRREALVAWVVAAPHTRADQDPATGLGAWLTDLNSQVKERLPQAWRPRLVPVETIPRRPGGKIDHRALPDPQSGADCAPSPTPEQTQPSTSGRSPSAPVHAAATLLRSLWAELIGLPIAPGEIDDQADFFALGGHSLTAARLVARLETACGAPVPLMMVFDHPTLLAMAEALTRHLHQSKQRPGDIPRLDRQGALPVPRAQQRLWVSAQLQDRDGRYLMSGTLRIHEDALLPRLPAAVQALVDRHEVLRTVMTAGPDGMPVLDIRPIGVAVPWQRESVTSAAQAIERAAWHARRPIALERAMPIRVTLIEWVEAGQAQGLLVLSMHHIASDGWSWGVMASELSALLQNQALPALTHQYLDVACWMDEQTNATLPTALHWWCERLRGVQPLRWSPPAPSTEATAVATRPLVIDGPLALAVARIASANGATGFMVMLAALAAAHHARTGQDDLAFGTDLAGRDGPESQRLIGFFVSEMLLRLDLKGDPTLKDVVVRSRDAALGAYRHRQVSFDQVRTALRAQSVELPLIQAKLSVLDHGPIVEPPGNATGDAPACEPVELPVSAIPNDLLINLVASRTPDRAVNHWRGSILWRPAVLGTQAIDRLIQDLQTVLELMADEPQMRLSRLSDRLHQPALGSARPSLAAGLQRRRSAQPTDAR